MCLFHVQQCRLRLVQDLSAIARRVDTSTCTSIAVSVPRETLRTTSSRRPSNTCPQSMVTRAGFRAVTFSELLPLGQPDRLSVPRGTLESAVALSILPAAYSEGRVFCVRGMPTNKEESRGWLSRLRADGRTTLKMPRCSTRNARLPRTTAEAKSVTRGTITPRALPRGQ